jgi:Tfp pilus assembly protein PilO
VVLSKRERYIGLAAAAAVGLLVLDHFILEPIMRAREAVDADIAAQEATLARNDRVIRERRRNMRVWADMLKSGLVRRDAAEAENEVLKELREWARESRMNLSSIKPERLEKEKEFQKATIRVTGTGEMAQVARFLWHVQTASIPVQINEMQLNTRKEGTDDLTLQLTLSSIHLASETEGRGQPATAPRPREATP